MRWAFKDHMPPISVSCLEVSFFFQLLTAFGPQNQARDFAITSCRTSPKCNSSATAPRLFLL